MAKAKLVFSISNVVEAKTKHFGYIKVYVLAKYDFEPPEEQVEVQRQRINGLLESKGGEAALQVQTRVSMANALWRLIRPVLSNTQQVGILENGPGVFAEIVEEEDAE